MARIITVRRFRSPFTVADAHEHQRTISSTSASTSERTKEQQGSLTRKRSLDPPLIGESYTSAAAECSNRADIHRSQIDAIDLATCANDRR